MKFENFTILDYKKYYKCIKLCSVTNQQYQVKLTNDEFTHYYKVNGKDVKHLTNHSKEDKLFLETTLTPEEIKLLTPQQKKLRKSLWKNIFRLNNKEIVNKELINEILENG